MWRKRNLFWFFYQSSVSVVWVITMINYDIILLPINFFAWTSLLVWLKHKNIKDLDKKLLKVRIFCFSIFDIAKWIIIGIPIIALYIMLQLLHLAVYDYFVLFILIILILNLIRQIVKTEKQFKRYSGHYSIKPPEGF